MATLVVLGANERRAVVGRAPAVCGRRGGLVTRPIRLPCAGSAPSSSVGGRAVADDVGRADAGRAPTWRRALGLPSTRGARAAAKPTPARRGRSALAGRSDCDEVGRGTLATCAHRVAPSPWKLAVNGGCCGGCCCSATSRLVDEPRARSSEAPSSAARERRRTSCASLACMMRCSMRKPRRAAATEATASSAMGGGAGAAPPDGDCGASPLEDAGGGRLVVGAVVGAACAPSPSRSHEGCVLAKKAASAPATPLPLRIAASTAAWFALLSRSAAIAAPSAAGRPSLARAAAVTVGCCCRLGRRSAPTSACSCRGTARRPGGASAPPDVRATPDATARAARRAATHACSTPTISLAQGTAYGSARRPCCSSRTACGPSQSPRRSSVSSVRLRWKTRAMTATSAWRLPGREKPAAVRVSSSGQRDRSRLTSDVLHSSSAANSLATPPSSVPSCVTPVPARPSARRRTEPLASSDASCSAPRAPSGLPARSSSRSDRLARTPRHSSASVSAVMPQLRNFSRRSVGASSPRRS